MMIQLWRTTRRFLKKLGLELPYDPAIPLLAYAPRKPESKEPHAPEANTGASPGVGKLCLSLWAFCLQIIYQMNGFF